MTNIIFEAWAWGLSAGLLGVVYIHILAKEEIFNSWWRIGAKYEGRWFFKPVWNCAHCFAGQFALWTYLTAAVWRFFYYRGQTVVFIPRALFGLTIVCSVAIFTAKVISWHFIKKNI